MNINRHNYEAFFLDHREGRLTPEQELELMEFLSLNPDLAAELTDYESVYLDREEIIFPEKSDIKKNKGALTPVEELIALMEGDLAQKETIALKRKIESDAYLKRQTELLSKTKLVPDLNVQFRGKNKLKRGRRVIYMWRYAAAAAIVIIGLGILFRNVPDKKQNETVAQKSAPSLPSPAPAVHDNDELNKKETLVDNSKPSTQSLREKKSIQTKKISEQPQLIASVPALPTNEITVAVENVSVKEEVTSVSASENSFTPGDIFSEKEWNELQRMSMAGKSSAVQELAKTSITRLGELTGVKVLLPNREKQQDVFAFSVGNFEVRHVSGK